jgi:hypothetical protein
MTSHLPTPTPLLHAPPALAAHRSLEHRSAESTRCHEAEAGSKHEEYSAKHYRMTSVAATPLKAVRFSRPPQ